MRAAAGSVPAAQPELGPKSSPSLRCFFQAAPISTASTLSIGDREEEEGEEAEEEVRKEEGARGWQPQLALMSTNIFKVQQGISWQANRARRSPHCSQPAALGRRGVRKALWRSAAGPAAEGGRRGQHGGSAMGGWRTPLRAGRFKCCRREESRGWSRGTSRERG